MNKIIKLQFHDADINERDGILKTYYLVNPERSKLIELKNMVEKRCEHARYEEDCSYWDVIDEFVQKNFETIEISDAFIIEY